MAIVLLTGHFFFSVLAPVLMIFFFSQDWIPDADETFCPMMDAGLQSIRNG
jgi:hypothetical protein